MLVGLGLAVVLGILLTAFGVFFLRRGPQEIASIKDLPAAHRYQATSPLLAGERRPAAISPQAHDTIFILPDISGYTRFMTGSRFAFGHAQHAVMALINAMIEAAVRRVELSKLEGDAALFFVDADRLSAEAVSETVMDIFAAFFAEREQLIAANICRCHACGHIGELDLKIFVHRGEATRFQFRGSVDHFGTDVIVLHRLMKNNVVGHRYVLVTEAAGDHIHLPADLERYEIEERVEHIGKVRALVYPIDDAKAAALARRLPPESISAFQDTYKKLQENMRAIAGAIRGR